MLLFEMKEITWIRPHLSSHERGLQYTTIQASGKSSLHVPNTHTPSDVCFVLTDESVNPLTDDPAKKAKCVGFTISNTQSFVSLSLPFFFFFFFSHSCDSSPLFFHFPNNCYNNTTTKNNDAGCHMEPGGRGATTWILQFIQEPILPVIPYSFFLLPLLLLPSLLLLFLLLLLMLLLRDPTCYQAAPKHVESIRKPLMSSRPSFIRTQEASDPAPFWFSANRI